MNTGLRVVPKPGLEQILFQSSSVTVGTFRCPAEHPQFEDSGPSNAYCFVFPRSTVWIQHQGGTPFLADPRVVTFYNEGQVYSRRRVSVDGDRAEWFALSPELAVEVLRSVAPHACGPGDYVFRRSHAPSDVATYLEQRRLVERCARREVDALEVEEQVIGLLARVAGRGGTVSAVESRSKANRRASLAEDARMLIASTVTERVQLADLAAALGCSVFHLCHRFRAAHGTTIQAYRQDLRLRASLERLRDGDRHITHLALDLGFSSHSHFTAAFRRHFGMTPSSFIARLAGRPDRRRHDEDAAGPVAVDPAVG